MPGRQTLRSALNPCFFYSWYCMMSESVLTCFSRAPFTWEQSAVNSTVFLLLFSKNNTCRWQCFKNYCRSHGIERNVEVVVFVLGPTSWQCALGVANHIVHVPESPILENFHLPWFDGDQSISKTSHSGILDQNAGVMYTNSRSQQTFTTFTWKHFV